MGKAGAALIVLAGLMPAQADEEMPWGFPECPRRTGPSDGHISQPYVIKQEQEDEIYRAIESYLDPTAPFFYPVIARDEHRDYVVVTRHALPDTPKRVFILGLWHNRSDEPPPLSMRIDKCDGGVSDVFIDKAQKK